mmetsp:Transcript_1346/g.3220  ORF Transcript_1346/g.3220 Transcript_1346/m.3220 type:complete len:397 (+) Transcript_1346:216-1406(+)
MQGSTVCVSALVLLLGLHASALRAPVLLSARQLASPHQRASCANQRPVSRIPLRVPRLVEPGRAERACRGSRSATTLCAAAEGGAGSRLDRLRKGMEAMGGKMPVTEDDLQSYSELLTSIMKAKEEEVPALLGSRVKFLLSADLSDLSSKFRARCSPDDLQLIDDAEDIIVTFLEEFVQQTSSMADQSRALLREILEASSQGMDVLDAKMSFVVSGQEPRYTAEFVRFLDQEIVRLGEVAAKQKAKKEEKSKAKKFASGQSVSLDTLADEQDEDEDEDEDEDKEAPDAATAVIVLAMIKARINAEMEEGLGEDAAPARLLSRLLQVDEQPRREMALQALLSEMRNDRERAHFFDVVQTTLDDIQDMTAEADGAGVDPELVDRLQHVLKSLKRALKF